MSHVPIEGVAYLLNDSVRVVSGPLIGQRGAVVALVGLIPEPYYRVEVGDGEEITVAESALLTSNVDDAATALAGLQRWYSSRCNDEWEHQLGVTIETLDNPGGMVTVDLEGTGLEDRAFSSVEKLEPVREWLSCHVEEGRFRGAGGPHMLGAIIEVFLAWVRDGEKGA